MECDYPHCYNQATHYDEVQNVVCEECVSRCIEEEGQDPEDFEEI